MTRVTQLIHDAGKYLLISVYPLPTHPTHNFTHTNGGNLETLPGWPKKLQHNRPARSARSAGQKRRLIVRSRKVSKPRDWYFKLSNRFEIWQAYRQHCCRSACQISERSDNSKYKSRGFETLRDLTERRLFRYWDGALECTYIAWSDEHLTIYQHMYSLIIIYCKYWSSYHC